MFNGLEHVALGGFILLAAYIIQRRTWRQQYRRSDRSTYDEAQREIIAMENQQRNELNQLHVRLHDFERMVDAKVQTRLLQLQQLLEEADQEIYRLNTEVARLRSDKKPAPPATDQFAQLMQDSGFDPEEIKHLSDLPRSMKRAG